MPSNNTSNDNILQWSAYEYIHAKKSADWFWVLGIISVAMSITAFIFKNVLFAILILLGAFTLTLFAKRKPEKISFSIDKQGISIGEEKYAWKSLESFSIVQKTNENILVLKSEKTFMPYLWLPLGEISPEKIYKILLVFLPEEEHEESFSELIMEYLGF